MRCSTSLSTPACLSRAYSSMKAVSTYSSVIGMARSPQMGAGGRSETDLSYPGQGIGFTAGPDRYVYPWQGSARPQVASVSDPERPQILNVRQRPELDIPGGGGNWFVRVDAGPVKGPSREVGPDVPRQTGRTTPGCVLPRHGRSQQPQRQQQIRHQDGSSGSITDASPCSRRAACHPAEKASSSGNANFDVFGVRLSIQST